MREGLLRAYDLYCRGMLFVVVIAVALAALLAVAEIGGQILWFLSFVSLPVSFWLLFRSHARAPARGWEGTALAAGLVLLMFVIHQFLWDREILRRFVLTRYLVLDGDYYRLFTAGFLHKDFGHLFFNSLGLFLVLPFVARHLGAPRALAIFFLSIPGCAILSALFAPPLTSALGASGGLLGLSGAVLVLLGRPAYRDSMSEEDLLYAFSLLPSGLGAAFYPGPMVDGPGHLGGYFTGILLALLLTWEALPALARWTAAVAGTALGVGALTFLVLPRTELARIDEHAIMIGRERLPAWLEYQKQRKLFLGTLPAFRPGAPPDTKFFSWARGDFERAVRAWKESLEEGMQKSEPFAAVRRRMHLEATLLLDVQQALLFDRAFEKPGWARESQEALTRADEYIDEEVRRAALDLRPSR